MHTFEIVSGRPLGLLSTCECKISKTSEMAAANRSRLFFTWKMARKCLPTTFKVNALTITDEPAMILFSNLQKSYKCYDIDESGMICQCGTFPLLILY